jgi:hypothetical protein
MVMKSLAAASTIATLGAALILITGAGVAVAETSSGGAPKTPDVATLRQLLALQYPALRLSNAASDGAGAPPSVTAEPDRGEAKPELQGGA